MDQLHNDKLREHHLIKRKEITNIDFQKSVDLKYEDILKRISINTTIISPKSLRALDLQYSEIRIENQLSGLKNK